MSFADMATREPITVKAETAEEIRERKDKAERDAIRAKILAAITARGRAATWESYGLSVGVGPDSEEETTISVDFERTLSGVKSYSWSYSPRIGPYAVSVGSYGDRKRFPPTKTGLSYDKIAADILQKADAVYNGWVADRIRAANLKISTDIILKLVGEEKYNGVLSKSYDGKVKFTVDRLNEEQAAKFVALAQELGLSP